MLLLLTRFANPVHVAVYLQVEPLLRLLEQEGRPALHPVLLLGELSAEENERVA